MTRIAALAALLALFASVPARAAGFDYYLLSLSWSPEYCAESHRGNEQQCARPYAFVAHGLWPQYERGGYPRNCSTRERIPDATIDRLLPIMPSKGLIIHEWRSHGACTGLAADAYFATIEKAYGSFHIPTRYSKLSEPLSVDPVVLKQDFMRNNPGVPASGITVQCSGNYLQELRLCLSRELKPRACARDVRDHCGSSAVLRPVR